MSQENVEIVRRADDAFLAGSTTPQAPSIYGRATNAVPVYEVQEIEGSR